MTNLKETTDTIDTNHNIHVVVLISNDGKEYKVSPKVAKLSKLVEETMKCNGNDDDDDGDDNVARTTITTGDTHSNYNINKTNSTDRHEVHLRNVNSECLSKVIEYCTYYVNIETMEPIETPLRGNTVEANVSQVWYKEFVNALDITMIYQLVSAANYLDIKPLFDLSFLVVTAYLYGKSAEQIRVSLNIPEMTLDEKERAMVEHRWIFGD